jgi:hypothetical protein
VARSGDTKQFWRHDLLKPLDGPAPDESAWIARRDLMLAARALIGQTDAGVIELVEGQTAEGAADGAGSKRTLTVCDDSDAENADGDAEDEDDPADLPSSSGPLADDPLVNDPLADDLCFDEALSSRATDRNAC